MARGIVSDWSSSLSVLWVRGPDCNSVISLLSSDVHVVPEHRLHCGEGLVQLLGASYEQLGLLADLISCLSVCLGDLERLDDLEDLLDLDLPLDLRKHVT